MGVQPDSKVVRVHDVVKDFRPGFGLRTKRILHGITFDVCEGEIFGFVGPKVLRTWRPRSLLRSGMLICVSC